MKTNQGNLTGKGQIVRANGTIEEFTITSEISEEQAEQLKALDLLEEDASNKEK